jgi:hypothetical protein
VTDKPAKPKHPGGRPTKYEPRFCDMVVEEMAKGYSLSAFCGIIGVSRATINNWMAENPGFLEAVNRAKVLRLLQWERSAMKLAFTGGGTGPQATLTMFGLKNMGGDEWADTQRVEAKIDAKVEVSTDDAFAELVGKLEGVARVATANHPAPDGLADDSEA